MPHWFATSWPAYWLAFLKIPGIFSILIKIQPIEYTNYFNGWTFKSLCLKILLHNTDYSSVHPKDRIICNLIWKHFSCLNTRIIPTQVWHLRHATYLSLKCVEVLCCYVRFISWCLGHNSTSAHTFRLLKRSALWTWSFSIRSFICSIRYIQPSGIHS